MRDQLSQALAVLPDLTAGHDEIGAGQHEAGVGDKARLIANVRAGISLGEAHGWDLVSQARLGRLVGELVCGRVITREER